MYSDEDLNTAVQRNIFTAEAVHHFRQHINEVRKSQSVDEENFRLINGFNDIFVVIASTLLLASLAWLGYSLSAPMAGLAVAAGSWGLAEYFVNRRRMALPAIALLLSFLGGLFATPFLFMQPDINANAFIAAGLLTTLGAVGHWARFRVPITVAAGAATLSAGIAASIVYLFPPLLTFIDNLVLLFGLLIFGLAMYWDSKDTVRQTRASDVAFWLHLIAAPMIVHPVFNNLGVLDGNGGVLISLVVLGLYILLALISLAVDRRAIMVSALVYVIYTFSSLMESYGMVTYGFALTGLCIGSSLLLLSAFWHGCRKRVLQLIPQPVQMKLPVVKI
ncbi:hypothetical protein [Alteromonas gilva]|uniref:DUF2157 domain-containing protein n=1 Tax=Alteromonas gilva TaxID=2987522 RepID=A0ABT5KXW0_9ALTE|nr:hypothetical protein [Alteromonas gilva]MDC8829609.1 hypothetical protein [Alteromonas gilva]